jgi:transcriptional regulator with XRE-family HTH domain
MAQTEDPDSRLAVVYLRSWRQWDQAGLARATGIAASQVSDFERGKKPVPRAALDRIARATGFPQHLLDPLLESLRSLRAAAEGRLSGDRAATDVKAAGLAALLRSATAVVSEVWTTRCARPAGLSPTAMREEAEKLWARLQPRTVEQRRLLVEDAGEYRSWALCERIAAVSIDTAANHPKKALELAQLAFRIAELVPGEEAWRWRLQGYAGAPIANAWRACNDLPAADEAMARARKLWDSGAAADPGLLNEAWLPWIQATLHRDNRSLGEALCCIDEALLLDRGELRGKILLSKANILKVLNDPEGSTAALAEASALIDWTREPRLALVLRFNLVADLCHLGRAEEARLRLPEVRDLAERLGEELDLVRVVWLEAQVANGLGQTVDALVAFERARQGFRDRELAYDYALVSLELSVSLLELGRTAPVREVAEEMLWIFRSQRVHREALAALQLFCEAARRETASVQLARCIVDFLHRAQHDPERASSRRPTLVEQRRPG